MKKSIALLALLYIAAIKKKKGTFTDTRDGKTYKTTKIGEQVWMAENLNYEAKRSKCYNDSISYCDKYGRLYDWATAMGIDKKFNRKKWNGSDVKHQGVCPKGWHLPNDEDWDKLYRYVDGDKGTESLYNSKTAGEYLKSKKGWDDYEGKSSNGLDVFGFSALPGGQRNFDPFVGFFYSFYGVGGSSSWWSANEGDRYDGRSAHIRHMNSNPRLLKGAGWGNKNKGESCSVRCVGD
ncbi:MAG: fibrobacter succinogenes major paralogous domain-containing protein [Fibromonadaceae bacterium]|jgi:uncharacterized protein (TIGR02145 family)|nr:fibrobacter succinogenes major paralogous domain-containing protein [Fibromonadaceae bacterium]